MNKLIAIIEHGPDQPWQEPNDTSPGGGIASWVFAFVALAVIFGLFYWFSTSDKNGELAGGMKFFGLILILMVIAALSKCG